MPLRVGDSMCQIGSHDGSMERLYVYLHGIPVYHENQPNVGKYIPVPWMLSGRGFVFGWFEIIFQ